MSRWKDGPGARRDEGWSSLRGRLAVRASEGLAAALAWVERAGAVGPEHRLAKRFGRFGVGTCVAFPPGAIFGEQGIHLGSGTLIGPRVTLSAGMGPGQVLGDEAVVVIGDRCLIGRGSHVVGHRSIVIEDDVFTGPYVYITDQNHGYEDLGSPVGVQVPVNRPVRIGAGSWLGAHSVVLPGAEIGRHVVVGAGAVVTGVLPDFCVAVGAPARVVRRFDGSGAWVEEPPRS